MKITFGRCTSVAAASDNTTSGKHNTTHKLTTLLRTQYVTIKPRHENNQNRICCPLFYRDPGTDAKQPPLASASISGASNHQLIHAVEATGQPQSAPSSTHTRGLPSAARLHDGTSDAKGMCSGWNDRATESHTGEPGTEVPGWAPARTPTDQMPQNAHPIPMPASRPPAPQAKTFTVRKMTGPGQFPFASCSAAA